MIRYIVGLLFPLMLFATAKSTIISISGNEAAIKPVDAVPGMSGIVIHRYDANHATIIARAVYDGKGKIHFMVYDALKQESLPKPKLAPKPGDEVFLGYLYDRATIIAPDLYTYQSVQNMLGEHLMWLHPDLLFSELAKNKDAAPTKEDLAKYCNKYAVGVLYIVFDGFVHQTDCYTLHSLKKAPVGVKPQKIQKPFYSRIEKVETSLFDFFGSTEMNDYNAYYRSMVIE